MFDELQGAYECCLHWTCRRRQINHWRTNPLPDSEYTPPPPSLPPSFPLSKLLPLFILLLDGGDQIDKQDSINTCSGVQEEAPS